MILFLRLSISANKTTNNANCSFNRRSRAASSEYWEWYSVSWLFKNVVYFLCFSISLIKTRFYHRKWITFWTASNLSFFSFSMINCNLLNYYSIWDRYFLYYVTVFWSFLCSYSNCLYCYFCKETTWASPSFSALALRSFLFAYYFSLLMRSIICSFSKSYFWWLCTFC